MPDIRTVPCGGIAVGAALMAIACAALAQEPAPQQSTTGPKPPPAAAVPTFLQAAPGAVVASIPGVPVYLWRHGCGPTSVGMVLGYYAARGFPDLFTGDASTQTPSVSQSIASQGSGTVGSGTQLHYEDYALPDDSSSSTVIADRSTAYPTGCHASDSIADFMHTSWSSVGNFYGWSWSSDIQSAFASYVHLRNPAYIPHSTQYSMGSSLTWSVLTNEIANNRPMVFLVDSSGDGRTDHFVPIVGYSDGPPQQYACYDTWYTPLRWCQFRAMSSSYTWGVYLGWSFSLSTNTPPVMLPVSAKQTATNGTGLVTLTAAVADADHDTCQVEICFSTDGGQAWSNAWIRSATASSGSVTFSNAAPRQLSGIVTAAGTNTLTILWSTTNNPAIGLCTNTLVRFRAWDGTNWSPGAISAAFTANNTAPAAPQALASPTHAAGVWTTNRAVSTAWTTATDAGGNRVRGYGYVFTNAAAPPIAPPILLTTAVTATSPPLADGSNAWFAVRSMDSNGNWSANASLGPFLIDSTGPIYGALSRSPANVTVAGAGSVTIALQVTDATSGLGTNTPQLGFDVGAGYSGWTDMAPAGGTLWSVDTPASNWLALSGTALCYKVRGRDSAGNQTESTAQTNYRLTAVPASNGSIGASATGWYAVGATAAVQAVAATYYHFAGWGGDAIAAQSIQNPLVLVMDQPHTLSALFTASLAPLQTPEWWLAAHGLTNGAWGAMEMDDTDHDGVPNWQEWVADTDPTNPGSFFRLVGALTGTNGLRLNWQGGTAASQFVEFAPALQGTATVWTTVRTFAPPTPAVSGATLEGLTPGFYRVRANR